MSGLKLFRTDTTNSGIAEVMPRLAEIEAGVQGMVEAHMETLLGDRFLASEYGTGPVHGGLGPRAGDSVEKAELRREPITEEQATGSSSGGWILLLIITAIAYATWSLRPTRAEPRQPRSLSWGAGSM